MAAAVVAVLLGRSAPGTTVPTENSFVVVFVAGAVTSALALVLVAFTRARPRPTDPDALAQTRAMNHEWG
jgi:hypothetical protein